MTSPQSNRIGQPSNPKFLSAETSMGNVDDIPPYNIFNVKKPQVRAITAYEVYDPITYEPLGLFKDSLAALDFAQEGGEQ